MCVSGMSFVQELFHSIYKVSSYDDTELERVDVLSEKALPYVTRTDLNNSAKSLVLSTGLANVEPGNAIVIGDRRLQFLTSRHRLWQANTSSLRAQIG